MSPVVFFFRILPLTTGSPQYLRKKKQLKLSTWVRCSFPVVFVYVQHPLVGASDITVVVS